MLLSFQYDRSDSNELWNPTVRACHVGVKFMRDATYNISRASSRLLTSSEDVNRGGAVQAFRPRPII